MYVTISAKYQSRLDTFAFDPFPARASPTAIFETGPLKSGVDDDGHGTQSTVGRPPSAGSIVLGALSLRIVEGPVDSQNPGEFSGAQHLVAGSLDLLYDYIVPG